MAAPSGTVWGSIVGSYGKLGVYRSVSSTNTQSTLTVEIWLWTKWSCSDTNNTLYYNNLASSGSATTSLGSVSIGTTVDTSWSTSNQVKLKSYSYTYTRGTSAQTRYLYAKLTNVDRVGGTMSVSTTASIPKLATYTVAYNANGGSGAPSSQTKYYGKNLTLSSTKPTRTGYSFQGWATSSSGSVSYAAGASYTANAAVTLYAVWKANTYTVKYNANGGSGAPANQTKTYGVTLTLSSTKPTRTNYNFLGWATTSTATTATYQAGGSYTANAAVTLYAVWELAYIAPKIIGISVARCDSDGTTNDEGVYARVKFSWSTYYETTQYTISYTNVETITNADGTVQPPQTICEAISLSDISWTDDNHTSGSLDVVIGGSLSTETSYKIAMTIGDSVDSVTITRTLSSLQLPIDVMTGGKKGIAFGSVADLENTVKLGWQTRSIHSDIAYQQKHANSGLLAGFGIGSGGINYGVWNGNLSKWAVKGAGDDLTLGTGTGAVKYSNTSGTTTLSDERLKEDFKSLDDWEAFFNSLEPCAFKMKNGNSGRYHLGFKAQQIEKALIDNGLTTQDFAGFVETKHITDASAPEDEAVYEEAGIGNGDSEYGLIYTEFVALAIHKIQKQQEEINSLKTSIEELKTLITGGQT